MRFKLEDAGGVAAREDRVGGSVVKRQTGKVNCHAAILLDQAHGVVEHGERGEAEKIHFQQADTLQRVHVVLRRDFILVRLVQRNDFRQRLRRDHHAGRVRGRVTRQSFQAQRHFHQLLDAIVRFPQRLELRRLFQRVLELDIQRRGDHLRDLVHFAIRHIERAPGVLEHGFCRHRAERDDLRDAFLSVGLTDVVNHLAAPTHAEINVNIGHRNALGVQESLEQQIVLQRVHVRDLQRVAHQAARSRASPRPHGNLLRARVTNEIPDDQEVAREAHLLNHLDFRRQAALVIG